MQYQVVGPFNWKGEMVEPGAIITPESPDDDDAVERLKQAGKIATLYGEPAGTAPPAAPGESTATEPMSSTNMPSHVGRRVPREHSTAEQ